MRLSWEAYMRCGMGICGAAGMTAMYSPRRAGARLRRLDIKLTHPSGQIVDPASMPLALPAIASPSPD
jgi:hypothetical protein